MGKFILENLKYILFLKGRLSEDLTEGDIEKLKGLCKILDKDDTIVSLQKKVGILVPVDGKEVSSVLKSELGEKIINVGSYFFPFGASIHDRVWHTLGNINIHDNNCYHTLIIITDSDFIPWMMQFLFQVLYGINTGYMKIPIEIGEVIGFDVEDGIIVHINEPARAIV